MAFASFEEQLNRFNNLNTSKTQRAMMTFSIMKKAYAGQDLQDIFDY